MRKLVSIQIVSSVEPIENADRIELVHVLGWQCVVKKGEFQIGDKCVYFEVDSFLPIRPEFEFLRASSYKNDAYMGEGFRLKTQMFRGVLSQGLCLSLDQFPVLKDMSVGTDVRDLLGVRKWEIESFSTSEGTVINTLPFDVDHTSEIRIQEEPGLISCFAGLEYYISTKMDGTSCSVSMDDKGFHVTGHNYEYADDGMSPFYEYIKRFDLDVFMPCFMARYGVKVFTIQGEFCGPGICQNRVGLHVPEWYVFTIKVDGKRVGLRRMVKICKDFGLKTVPIEEVDVGFDKKYPTIVDVLRRADGKYENGRKKEGIVVRPTEPVMCDLIGSLLSMKVINNSFLLKCN